MHTPRRCRRLARLVLAWFALWLGVTLASPMVAGAELQLVCSGSSFKLVSGDKDAPKAAGHLAQCPACVQIAAPLPAPLVLPVAGATEVPLRIAMVAQHHPQPQAPPPQGRAPPALS